MNIQQKPHFADGYRRLGILRRKKREYRKAIALFQKELAIRSIHKNNDPVKYYECKLRLAGAFNDVREYAGVLNTIEGDVQQYKLLTGDVSRQTEKALCLLGTANLWAGSDELARMYLLEAVQIAELNNEEDSLRSSGLYLELGWAHRNLGDNDGAKKWLVKSINTYKPHRLSNYFSAHYNTALGYLSLGRISRDEGELDRATFHVKYSLRIFSEKCSNDSRIIVRCVSILSDIYIARGNFAEAIKILFEYFLKTDKSGEREGEALKTLREKLIDVLETSISKNTKDNWEDKLRLLEEERKLAMVYFFNGQQEESFRCLHENTRHFNNFRSDNDTLLAIDHEANIAINHLAAGSSEQAVSVMSNVYERFSRALGPDHPACIYCVEKMDRLKETMQKAN